MLLAAYHPNQYRAELPSIPSQFARRRALTTQPTAPRPKSQASWADPPALCLARSRSLPPRSPASRPSVPMVAPPPPPSASQKGKATRTPAHDAPRALREPEPSPRPHPGRNAQHGAHGTRPWAPWGWAWSATSRREEGAACHHSSTPVMPSRMGTALPPPTKSMLWISMPRRSRGELHSMR